MKTKILVLIPLIFFACSKKSLQNDELQPEEVSKFVTFNKDIKPFLIDKCSPCHAANGDRNVKYVTYKDASISITGIMGRVTKEITDPLLMPKGGPKLSNAEIALLNQWIKDGLLEK